MWQTCALGTFRETPNINKCSPFFKVYAQRQAPPKQERS